MKAVARPIAKRGRLKLRGGEGEQGHRINRGARDEAGEYTHQTAAVEAAQVFRVLGKAERWLDFAQADDLGRTVRWEIGCAGWSEAGRAGLSPPVVGNLEFGRVAGERKLASSPNRRSSMMEARPYNSISEFCSG